MQRSGRALLAVFGALLVSCSPSKSSDGPADAAGESGIPLLPDGAPACPQNDRGPAMVYGGRYCIDSTEVTQGNYQAFLADTAKDPNLQPPVCKFNTSYQTSDLCLFDPANRPNAPVIGVDWCDAAAFCAWAGKRLCGAIGGGALTAAPDLDPSRAQWYAACTNNGDGSHAFPYGNTYDPKICNGADQRPINVAGIVDVGQNQGCTGGLPGIYDMSGNVWEWEDSCQPANGGETDMCLRRGASFQSPTADQMSCKAWQLTPRKTHQCDIGFRCCSDVP